MNKLCVVAAVCGAVAVLALAGSPQAGERRAAKTYVQGHMEPTKSGYRAKRGTRVRGFLGRRLGFYSYIDFDVINVYGGSRALFGSTNSYREPFSDRQAERARSITGSSSTQGSARAAATHPIRAEGEEAPGASAGTLPAVEGKSGCD